MGWARGELASSNSVQVKKVRTIIETLGLQVATPDEAREILGLKGGGSGLFLRNAVRKFNLFEIGGFICSVFG